MLFDSLTLQTSSLSRLGELVSRPCELVAYLARAS